MGSNFALEKVGECLYRNPSSRKYYAIIKIRGKQIKRSLETADLNEARRKLVDFKKDQAKVDLEAARLAGRITVGALCDRFEAAMASQAPKTIARKLGIIKSIRKKWKDDLARRILKSEVMAWLASFSFGAASYNLHLQTVRAVFQLAVDDHLLPTNPVTGIRQKKKTKPIRLTPTPDQFKAIVAHIRGQKLADTAEESADYVEFLGLAGLGQAEASSLVWSTVDFQRDQLTIRRHKTGEVFTVPIYPQLRPLLLKRLNLAKAANGGLSPLPEGKVFSVTNPKKALEAACKRLHLPAFTCRSLRRLGSSSLSVELRFE